MTNIEDPAKTPEELAAYQARFLPGAPPVTEAALRRHADVHGGYMVAETAWEHGLKAPVPPEDPPSQTSTLKRRKRR